MNQFQVLSREEVEEILKVTEGNTEGLNALITNTEVDQQVLDAATLANLSELTKQEFEKLLSSFARKKMLIKTNGFSTVELSAVLEQAQSQHIISVFQLSPHHSHGLVIWPYALLHHIITLIYGGQVNTSEPIMEKVGHITLLVAERISQITLEALSHAAKEYETMGAEVIKTIAHANLPANIQLSNQLNVLDLSVTFDELDIPFKLVLNNHFLKPKVAVEINDNQEQEKDFWQGMIKSQVIDSYVTVNIALPDVRINAQDFMNLKAGGIIPIGDPTQVYVSLNNVKLFKASAGQMNAKLVAKIDSKI